MESPPGRALAGRRRVPTKPSSRPNTTKAAIAASRRCSGATASPAHEARRSGTRAFTVDPAGLLWHRWLVEGVVSLGDGFGRRLRGGRALLGAGAYSERDEGEEPRCEEVVHRHAGGSSNQAAGAGRHAQQAARTTLRRRLRLPPASGKGKRRLRRGAGPEVSVGRQRPDASSRSWKAVRYVAVGGPDQVVSASGSPGWVRSPTQPTYPSGRIDTAVGAVTAPSTGSSHGPTYFASID